MARYLELYLDQGSEFSALLPPVTNSDLSVLNLSGFTPSSLMRRSYTTQFAVEITAEVYDEATGIIQLSLTKNETINLSGARWVYDVIITDDETEEITRVFEGIVFVNPSVTSKLNTTLLSPYVPEDFGG